MSADAPASVPDPEPTPGLPPGITDSQDSTVASPPPPRRPRRRPRWLLPVVSGVLAAALIAGLLVWQPWSPRPVAPATLTAQSPSGTSVLLTWTAPHGGATPGQYVILRDGKQVAEVAGDDTSWADVGLRPGDKFRYEVATRAGGWQSGPSPTAAVTVIAPSPIGLAVTSTYSSATLTWEPSPIGPAPDKYLVYNGGDQVGTFSGATTTYTLTGIGQDTAYQYTVVAQWGTVRSAPSVTDSGTTLVAPLDNLQDVVVTPTSIPSGATGATLDKAFPTSWNFFPQCAKDACTMTVNVVVPGVSERPIGLTITVKPSGAGYTGSAHEKFIECAGVPTDDTIKLSLVPDQSEISNGQWGHWNGTVVVSAPYIAVSDGYCSASTWDFKASPGGSGGASSPAAA
jgi:hypothetical protein